MGKAEDLAVNKGFLTGLYDIMGRCIQNNTDNTSIEIDLNGYVLVVDIKFSHKVAEA